MFDNPSKSQPAADFPAVSHVIPQQHIEAIEDNFERERVANVHFNPAIQGLGYGMTA